MQINDWLQKNNISEQGESVINLVRRSEPSRSTQNRYGNVTGRYPSRKMGSTIQFESHKNELGCIYQLEYDPSVLEYYDQPPKIKLEYKTKKGRQTGVLHTPDFFIIKKDLVGWRECKTETDLIKLAEKQPNRYVRDENGKWRCPPGEKYAQQFDFFYEVFSSSEIDWVFQRNIEFLEDYFRIDIPKVNNAIREKIIDCVKNCVGINLAELFIRLEATAYRDGVFMLIAHGELFVNLHSAPLVEPEKVCVFTDEECAKAYIILKTGPTLLFGDTALSMSFPIGSTIFWGNKEWTIVNIDEKQVSLLSNNQEFIELPLSTFEKLAMEKRIINSNTSNNTLFQQCAIKKLAEARSESLAIANFRNRVIQFWLENKSLPSDVEIDSRTVRRWIRRKKESEMIYGYGYIGLIPKPRIGNKNKRLPLETWELLLDFIDKDYETLKQKRKFEVYATYKLSCEKRGVIPASYKTFCQAVKDRPIYKQTEKRQGKRAAYKHKPFYWNLTMETPRHGERPFHIAHIDHTELDIELVCSQTGANFGRPWATFMMDAFTRRVLACYLAYHPPSKVSTMMIMRDCVRRYGRLPQTIVVDNAPEFSSTYFETLLAFYECTKKQRPPSESRFGSVGERLFGTTDTRYIYNLQGNTQITKNVRQVTKSVNPKTIAIWPLGKSYDYLCKWLFDVYDTIDHPALGQSPRDAFLTGMKNSGERLHRMIPYDETFRLLTMLSGQKNTAKVQPSSGVKVMRIYYWNEIFREPDVINKSVPVRYDPLNRGRAYAYVKGQWVECHSSYFTTFQNRTDWEIAIASKELSERLAKHDTKQDITASKLAHFIEEIEGEEILLRQRLIDYESRYIWDTINLSPALTPVNSTQSSHVAIAESQLSNSQPISSVFPENYLPNAFEDYEEF